MSSEDILSQTPNAADARISYGKDPNQFTDLRLPKSSGLLPVASVIHGGFWRSRYDLAHAGHLAAALTHAGIATLNIEYRRVGNPGGGWPGTRADVEAAFLLVSEVAQKYRLDMNRVVAIGHSAGGQLALTLAAHQPALRGVVALAPVSDLRRAYDLHLSNDAVVEFLGGTPSQVPEHYAEASPIELPIAVPQVIIHGRRDDIVPVDMSRNYVEVKHKRGENVRLIERDCGHFELIDPSSSAWSEVKRAALELLKP